MKVQTRKEFCLSLEVLSPLSINNGTVLSPLTDYFVLNNRLFYVDEDKFLNLLEKDMHLLNLYEENVQRIKIENAGNFLNKLITDESKLRGIGQEPGIEYTGSKTIELATVIKSNGKPYIPGSSIKGAIKNAFLYYWLTNISEGQKKLSEFIDNNKNDFQRISSQLDSKISDLSRLEEEEKELKRQSKSLSKTKREEIKSIREIIKRLIKSTSTSINIFKDEIEQIAFAIPDKSKNKSTDNSTRAKIPLRQPSSNLLIEDSDSVGKDRLSVSDLRRKSLSGSDWILSLQEHIKPGTNFHFKMKFNMAVNDWKEQNTESSFSKLLRTTDSLSEFFNVLNYFHTETKNLNTDFDLQEISVDIQPGETFLYLGSGKGVFRNTVLLAIKKYYLKHNMDFKKDFIPVLYSNSVKYDNFPNSISYINNSLLGWSKITLI